MKRPRAKPCNWLRTSCRFPQNSFPAQENSSMPRRMEKIREAGDNELAAQEKELTETIFQLRFQLSNGYEEPLRRLREARKDLARVDIPRRAQELAKKA